MRDEKRMRKAAVYLLCMSLLLSLAACSERPENLRVGSQEASVETEAPEPAPQEPETAPTAEPETDPKETAAQEEAPEDEEPAGEATMTEAAQEPEQAPSAESAPAEKQGGVWETAAWIEEPTPEARAAALGLPAPPEVDIHSWEFVLPNTYNSIREYRPNYGSAEGVEFDMRASGAATDFLSAARAAGYNVFAREGYLGVEVQDEFVFAPVKAEYGGSAWAASQHEFCAGTSDHQTALGMDVMYGNWENYTAAEEITGTDGYQWMVEHCADYGFILRYPEGQEGWYGLACQHRGVHFRYVGETAARYIMDNGICLEEFALIMDPNYIYVPGVN